MGRIIGSQSIQFDKPVYILGAGSIVGKKEGEGPLGKYFDKIGPEDVIFGCRSWDEAESTLQKEALSLAVD